MHIERGLMRCQITAGIFQRNCSALIRDVCVYLETVVFPERFRCSRNGVLPPVYILPWMPTYLHVDQVAEFRLADAMLDQIMAFIETQAKMQTIQRSNARVITAISELF